MANFDENILLFQQRIAEQQAHILGQNFETISSQLTGLTSAVYTQSVSQIVNTFEGDPKQFKEWVKSIEKYAKLTNLNDKDVPKVAYQKLLGTCSRFCEKVFNRTRK